MLPPPAQPRQRELYIKHRVPLPHPDTGTAQATCLMGDARCIVAGFDDATLAAFSWSGKVRDSPAPHPTPCGGTPPSPPLMASVVDLAPTKRARARATSCSAKQLITGCIPCSLPPPPPHTHDSMHSCDACPAPPAAGRMARAQVLAEYADPLAEELEEAAAGQLLATAAVANGSSHSSSSQQPQAQPQASPAQHGALGTPFGGAANGGLAAVWRAGAPARSALVSLHHCKAAHMLAAVLADGSVAMLSAPEGDLLPLSQLEFSHWLCGPGVGAVAAAVSAHAQLVAVGSRSGDVHLYALPATSTGSSHLSIQGAAPCAPLLRSLCLDHWGHKPSELGAVSALQWAPDGRALAVGYSRQGVTVWSPSGCRLLCTLRQPGGSVAGAAEPAAGRGGGGAGSVMAGGVAGLVWGVHSYRCVGAP